MHSLLLTRVLLRHRGITLDVNLARPRSAYCHLIQLRERSTPGAGAVKKEEEREREREREGSDGKRNEEHDDLNLSLLS